MNKLLIVTTENDNSHVLIKQAIINNDSWESFSILFSESLEKIMGVVENYQPTHVYIRDPFNKGFADDDLDKKLKFLIALKNALQVDKVTDLLDVYFEDKWLQYQVFSEYMPNTVLLNSKESNEDLQNKIFKKRISSRAKGISFTNPENQDDYVAQERLDIKKEYRIFSVNKNILDTAEIKLPKTESQKVKIVGFEPLTEQLRKFVEKIDKQHKFEIVGYDVAELSDGTLKLIELNRSPQYSGFYKGTGVNIFENYLVNR